MISCTRRPSRTARSRELHPVAEGLEDRTLLYATLGGQWVFGDRITYSFAPDGTNVGGLPSAWHQAMASRGISEQAWKNEFRAAAATWQAVTGINVVEVPDNGAAFSVSGNQQNDPRFGDIRIAGVGLGSSTLGMAFLPPQFNGGTLAGDIVMNTQVAWNVNTTYDIRTVAIHEFGHSLGMDHATITSAVMYAYYTGTKQSLSTDDVNGLRSIYGERSPDAFDAWSSNQTFATATNVTPYLDANKQIRLAPLDINTSSDVDWYYVKAPANPSSVLTAAVQSQALSSLSPSVVVYNKSLQVLASASAPNSYGATVATYVPNVTAGQEYYIRVQAANGGPSGNGSYALLANFGTSPLYLVPPPNTTVPQQPNRGGGSIALSELKAQLESAMASLNPEMRIQVERAIAANVNQRDGTVNTLPLVVELEAILERLTPRARQQFEAALPISPEHVVQLGGLVGFGSTLTPAELGLEIVRERTPAPASTGANPGTLGAFGVEDGLVIVLTGDELDPVTAVRNRARDRGATRAIDSVLGAWN